MARLRERLPERDDRDPPDEPEARAPPPLDRDRELPPRELLERLPLRDPDARLLVERERPLRDPPLLRDVPEREPDRVPPVAVRRDVEPVRRAPPMFMVSPSSSMLLMRLLLPVRPLLVIVVPALRPLRDLVRLDWFLRFVAIS